MSERKQSYLVANYEEIRRYRSIREVEFRRGYADGWTDCMDTIFKATFMFKYFDYLIDLLEQHATRDIEQWKAMNPEDLYPPPRFRGLICTYCGAPANTIDHIKPRSRGGSEDRKNLTPACKSCNSSKGTKLLTEWDQYKNGNFNRDSYDWKKAYEKYKQRITQNELIRRADSRKGLSDEMV